MCVMRTDHVRIESPRLQFKLNLRHGVLLAAREFPDGSSPIWLRAMPCPGIHDYAYLVRHGTEARS